MWRETNKQKDWGWVITLHPSSSLSLSHALISSLLRVSPQNWWMKTSLASHLQNFQYSAIDWFFSFLCGWLGYQWFLSFRNQYWFHGSTPVFVMISDPKRHCSLLTTQDTRHEGILMSICIYNFWCVITILFFFLFFKWMIFVQYTCCREHLLGDSSIKFCGISSLFNPQLSSSNDEAMLISIGSS